MLFYPAGYGNNSLSLWPRRIDYLKKGSLANGTHNKIVIYVVHRVECINLMYPVSIATVVGLFVKMCKSFTFHNILKNIPATHRNKKKLLNNFAILVEAGVRN